ncbi:alpha/beta fold hydrolase [Psychrobacter submarinus]|uniref:alpha/beta fold hydrolase n=1 Tax=Psychrobacter submarinus TaxID=154108 RepID=UPI003F696FC8
MQKRLAKILLFAILASGISLAALIAVYWASDKSVKALKKWQLPNSEFIKIDGMQVHVLRSAKCANADTAKTIVLLHGTSASLHTWQGWMDELSDEYCVVSMDLPGFGLTGPYANDATQYTSVNYADFVIQVLDQLNVDKVILAGNSLGGKIAWRTAALYPERVDTLILVDAVGYRTTPKSIPIGFRLAAYPILKPILSNILPRSVVKKSILSVYADDSKVDNELVDRYYDLSLRTGNRSALSDRLREFDNFEDQAQIKSLIQPTLLLWGAQDYLIPVENAYLFHQDIANSQLKVFEDLGHVPHEEDPQATVAVVKDFLAQTD